MADSGVAGVGCYRTGCGSLLKELGLLLFGLRGERGKGLRSWDYGKNLFPMIFDL